MGFTYSQKVALAVLPKISGTFSIIGSMWIMIEVVTNRNKRRVPYHRLLFAMSFYDVLESLSSFFSTWAIPKGSPNIIWAYGNDATCTIQGFMLQLTLAVPLYNAMLSIYYVLVINYRYTDAKLRRFAEPMMHFFCFAWPFGTGMYSLLTKQINNANLWCWLAPLPAGCLNSWEYGTAEEGNPNPCIRGDNIWAYRFGFYFIPLWISIFTATVCTFMVYKYVHHQDKATLNYRQPERKSADNFSLSLKKTNSGDFKKIAKSADESALVDDKDELPSDRTSIDHPSGEFSLPKDGGKESEEENEECKGREPSDAWTISMREALKRGDSSDYDDSMNNPSAKDEAEEEEDDDDDSLDNPAAQINQEKPKPKRGLSVKNRFVTWREKRVKYAQDMPHAVEVFHQACLFLGVFYCTHLWSTSNRVLQAVTGSSLYPILVLHSFFDPFQGFLNFFVYQYPRYKKLRKRNPDASRVSLLKELFRFSFMGTKMGTGNRSSYAGRASYSRARSGMQSQQSNMMKLSSVNRTSSERKSGCLPSEELKS